MRSLWHGAIRPKRAIAPYGRALDRMSD